MPMRPRVVIYDAVSADGSIEGFEPDVGLFYQLAAQIGEDCTLAGANTMLAGEPDNPSDPPLAGAVIGDKRPLLVVVDARGRFRGYRNAMTFGAWGRAIALCSETTPVEHLEYLRTAGVEIGTFGVDRVELGEALEWLAESHGVRLVRVESGGLLNGALVERGLVDEAHLLIHPVLVGNGRSFYRPGGAHPVAMRLLSSEALDGRALYVRWGVGADSEMQEGPA
jgi:2,5-diamino-6-(ribosylamino)-4(3H)-pyrimidinone 5'-phosphate reductase